MKEIISFGYWLRVEMDRYYISSAELAFHSGLGDTTINAYRQNKAIPHFKHAVFVSNALAQIANVRLFMNLSRQEVQLLSDRMLLEMSRLI